MQLPQLVDSAPVISPEKSVLTGFLATAPRHVGGSRCERTSEAGASLLQGDKIGQVNRQYVSGGQSFKCSRRRIRTCSLKSRRAPPHDHSNPAIPIHEHDVTPPDLM